MPEAQPGRAGRDARRLVAARALRGLADGLVSVLLPAQLLAAGFSGFEIGALVAATLVGSAALTLAVGLFAGRFAPRAVLLAATPLVFFTGAGFGSLESLPALLLVGFVGTFNPSAGDVSLFLPTEQAMLAGAVGPERRTAVYARYNLAGALATALGALAVGVPGRIGEALGLPAEVAGRLGWAFYAATALPLAWLYLGLAPAPPAPSAPGAARAPLARSRRTVLELSALFSLDSFGGGFAVQTILATWLFQRFGMSVEEAGAFFFGTALLSAVSQLGSSWLAARIGMIRTMVYTHVPANLFLAAAAFMPTAPLVLGCLLVRALLSQMDVPARQAFVMWVVPPEERAAAASVTNVPRSLATAASPPLAGALLTASGIGWPLFAGGSLKLVYDALLLARFRSAERSHSAPSA
jgi:MFS family permease